MIHRTSSVRSHLRGAALLILSTAMLAGCNTDRGGPSPFSGFNFGTTLGGSSTGHDAYGRRVDLDSASTSPSLPSMGTPGLGK